MDCSNEWSIHIAKGIEWQQVKRTKKGRMGKGATGFDLTLKKGAEKATTEPTGAELSAMPLQIGVSVNYLNHTIKLFRICGPLP